MSRPAPAGKAAGEVLAGDPRAAARAWLRPLIVVVGILFAVDTYLVATEPLLPFDVPVTSLVQSFRWGPVTYVFDLINYTAGYVQVVVGIAAKMTTSNTKPLASPIQLKNGKLRASGPQFVAWTSRSTSASCGMNGWPAT